jgi:hypothetical protein
MIDRDLPGPVGLLAHDFDTFGADLYFMVIRDVPFGPAEREIPRLLKSYILNTVAGSPVLKASASAA